MVVSAHGSLPLAVAKLMTEVLILSRLVFVVDSLVLSIDDRQIVKPAPTINPIMMRTMESSISEKP